MLGGRKRILSPFTGRKKNEKSGRLEKTGKTKTKLSWNRQRIILQRGIFRRIFRQ